MALVPCPECRAQVSPSAASCPRCGFRLDGGQHTRAGAAFAPGGAPTQETVLWESAPSLRVSAAEASLLAMAAPALIALTGPALSWVARTSTPFADIVIRWRSQIELAVAVIVTLLAAGRVVRIIARAIALRAHHYRLSNQRLLIETGVLSKTLREIDVRAIDDIALTQSLLGRLLAVGEITLVAAEPDTHHPRSKVRLLAVLDPREVREVIRNAAYEATRGQVFVRGT